MNNRGWGLQEMLVCLLVLATALIISVILINQNFKKINNTLNQNKADNNAVMSGVDQDPSEEPSVNDSDNKPVEEEPVKPTAPEKKEYASYQEIETDMIEAAKKYQNDIYGTELLEGDKISVTITALVREKYLNEIADIKDNKTKCSGYVTFIKQHNNIDYKAYIKCGNNYQTEGYLSRLDDSE